MIIKSLSRKTASHHQLVRYIFTDKDGREDERQFSILHGIETDLDKENLDKSLLDIADEFVQNMRFTKQRKNGVTMYHEVLSFDPQVAKNVTRDMLEEITQKYIDTRAENAIVLARPHFDTDAVHVHLMISPNEQRSAKRVRMSIKEFEECKTITRQYQRERYPQISPVKELKLKQGQYRDHWQRENRKAQMKQLDKPLSEREMVQDTLIRAVESSANLKQVERFLNRYGVQTYQRREVPTGVTIGKRKYRYETLLKETTLFQKIKRLVSKERGQKKVRGNERKKQIKRRF